METETNQNTLQVGKNAFYIYINTIIKSAPKIELGSLLRVSFELDSEDSNKVDLVRDRIKSLSLRQNQYLYINSSIISGRNSAAGVTCYGSCRKLSLLGGDVVTRMLARVKDSFHEANELPLKLILGGDQIYADDLDKEYFLAVLKIVKIVFGSIPIGGNRTELLASLGLTTEEGEYHLLSFEEYSSLVLLSWSSVVANMVSDQLSNFEGYISEVRAWETILASMPVYMLHDDHDVTDDWNLNAEWLRNVNSSPSGREFLNSAKSALLLNQVIGNDPKLYPQRELSRLADDILNNRKVDVFSNHDLVGWSFCIPGQIPSIFLDTRLSRTQNTLRNRWISDYSIDSEIIKRTPSTEEQTVLISDTELVKGLVELRDKGGSIDTLIIYVSTPLLSKPIIDSIQKIAGRLSSRFRLYLDSEGWTTNPLSWYFLLKKVREIINPKKVVFISGDLHFSFHAKGKVIFEDMHEIELEQITSSPLKNKARLSLLIKAADIASKSKEYSSIVWRNSNSTFSSLAVSLHTQVKISLIERFIIEKSIKPVQLIWSFESDTIANKNTYVELTTKQGNVAYEFITNP